MGPLHCFGFGFSSRRARSRQEPLWSDMHENTRFRRSSHGPTEQDDYPPKHGLYVAIDRDPAAYILWTKRDEGEEGGWGEMGDGRGGGDIWIAVGIAGRISCPVQSSSPSVGRKSMSLAAFLPLRSPYPHHRSPPNAFSPRVSFRHTEADANIRSPRPALAPMSRIRIETVSRRTNDLPRDPSDWVDKDLLSYVRYNYSPIEAVPLSEVIERDRLTPTALWYLQAEPEQLLAITEEESLRNTLLGLALSLKPAVSPTSPRIRHVRRLSEDLERPPPPPPPPPPSPPTPEEPELEEDDDVAESIVSDWALDEDLDGDDGTTPTMDDLGDLAEFATQPDPPLEGLGLHTGEPHLNSLPTPQPQPMSMDTDDLINLEDEAQPTLPQEEATEPHASRTDTDATDDPPVEQATSSQGASTDAHVPDAAEEKPPAATHSADPSPPPDKPSAPREAGAGMPVDPFAGSNTFGSPIDDDDLGNPRADLEDPSGPDPSPTPPPAADPARTATPTSDYHDANSTHSGEGERPEATPAEQEHGPSPVHPQEQESSTTSGNEDQSSTETPLPIETPVQGESGDNASSGNATPTGEEVQPEENPAPASSEDPFEPPPPTTKPVQTAPPATDPAVAPPPATDSAEPSPSVTNPAQPSPSVTEPVSTPAEETTQTLKEDISPAADPDRDETAHVGPDETKDAETKEPSVQSTTTSSGIPTLEQSQETAEAEDRESAHLRGEESADKAGDETVEQAGEEVVDKASEGEEEVVPATTTTESVEMTTPPEVTTGTVDNSPAPEGSSDDVSGVQANEQTSASETQAVSSEAEVNSSSTTQDEGTPEKSSTPSGPPAPESTPSPLLSTDITTEPTATTTAFDPPPSPTVRLASGIEAQLIDRDPESTEQSPSASPGDTPPNESSSASESRQASPPAETEVPAETEAEKPPPVPRGRNPSPSSVSPVISAEGKRPAPPRLNTAFGSSSEPSRSATSARPRADNSAWQQSPASRSAFSPAAAKTIGWGSAQSPAAKPPAWGRVFNSVTSFFAPPSEPSTRDSSQERETPDPCTPAPPAPAAARQPPAVRPSPWGKNRNRPGLAASSPSPQQASKPQQPPPLAAEPSVSVSPAQASPPADTDSNGNTSVPTPASSSDPSPPEGSAIRETNPQAEELTDVVLDGILVDSRTPSAGNGEPVRDAESSRAPTMPTVASSEGDSPDVDVAGGKDETKDAEDEDMFKITADDIVGADKEEGSESRPQGNMDLDEDEEENTPLNLHLDRVGQMTGDSVSSAATSDTETQGEEERPGHRMGSKLQTSGLASEPDGVGSPAVESPTVGTPTQSKAKKRKNKKKKGNGGP
ncbi:hypothetical protein V8D89_015461 [Ganoderma adspersum]